MSAKPTTWRVSIEGFLGGKSFIQNVYVSAVARQSAINLARARFEQLGAEFVEVAETEPASDVVLQLDEIQVSGRIFFD